MERPANRSINIQSELAKRNAQLQTLRAYLTDKRASLTPAAEKALLGAIRRLEEMV